MCPPASFSDVCCMLVVPSWEKYTRQCGNSHSSTNINFLRSDKHYQIRKEQPILTLIFISIAIRYSWHSVSKMTENSAALAAVSAGAGERKINICSINEMVTCKICSGYLVSIYKSIFHVFYDVYWRESWFKYKENRKHDIKTLSVTLPNLSHRLMPPQWPSVFIPSARAALLNTWRTTSTARSVTWWSTNPILWTTLPLTELCRTLSTRWSI